ncbi:hypothetical protein IG193_00390 [Infirmifilum lucidum]|uniref:DUF11 domain-containing protein n=1 Tax=Infirmifilum lucidum TaxID=2776706 RepID=A0A7L9FGN1_9CREN|nr:BatD family protein [Infirmifilum lucidum]QOJ78960.1 hypothetical protein IG193_00390 [Infirmifilum lucidum]
MLRERYGYIEHRTVDELAERGPSFLGDLLKELDGIEDQISRARLLSSDMKHLLERVKGYKEKVRSAYEKARDICVKLQIRADKGSVVTGDTVQVTLRAINCSLFDVELEFPESWPDKVSDGLELVAPQKPPKPFKVPLGKGEDATYTFTYRAEKEGRHAIGGMFVHARGGGASRQLQINLIEVIVRAPGAERKPGVEKPLVEAAPAPRVEIELRKTVERDKVFEGESIRVNVHVRNRGNIATPLAVRNDEKAVSGDSSWSGTLGPGEEYTLSYEVKAEKRGVITLEPAVAECYVDGKLYTFRSNSVSVNVLPREEERIDVDQLVNGVVQKGLLFMVGYLVARGKEVKVPKKTIVENIRAVEKRDEGKLYVLEHPISVVIEEHDDFVRLRRASPAELSSAVDAATAERLESAFIGIMEGRLSAWRPREAEKFKKESISDPPNGLGVVYTYLRGGLVPRAVSRVYVLTYSRRDKLSKYGVDHYPLSTKEVSRAIGVVEGKDEPAIVIVGSPTGWDEEAKKFARHYVNPRIGLLLVDLKTMELYYNPQGLVQEVVDLVPDFGKLVQPVPEECLETVERLDDALLNGVITQDDYLRKIGEEVQVCLQRKEKVLAGPLPEKT